MDGFYVSVPVALHVCLCIDVHADKNVWNAVGMPMVPNLII